MKQNFCETHTIAFLKGWDSARKPLDLSLSEYFRAHKSLGATDRRTMGEWIYSLIRWKSLFDELDPPGCFSKRLHLLQQRPIADWRRTTDLSDAARLGLTPFLWGKLTEAYGDENARKIAEVLNSAAPIAVRANLLKTTREKLLQLWEGKFSVSASNRASAAILFGQREPLFALPEFRQGLFEVQDEGSQLVADLIEARPGDRILDFCAGSGGKSLSFAPRMQGKGEIYLHDIRSSALQEASRRLRRAGIQNAQTLLPDHPTLLKLVGKMDWVLADVPCSGTGTLRRNPEMKWKIDSAMLERLRGEQRAIFERAVSFAKKGGRIVYATCSILPEENSTQVEYFLSRLPISLEKAPLTLLPERGGCDGFFAAVFKKI